jgi:hypothetical protein
MEINGVRAFEIDILALVVYIGNRLKHQIPLTGISLKPALQTSSKFRLVLRCISSWFCKGLMSAFGTKQSFNGCFFVSILGRLCGIS